jgi:hypothetical protein
VIKSEWPHRVSPLDKIQKTTHAELKREWFQTAHAELKRELKREYFQQVSPGFTRFHQISPGFAKDKHTS